MYKFSKEQVIEPAFLTKLVQHFRANEIPRFRRLEAYYRVKNMILSRTMEQGKPNNRLAHGFSKYISNMSTSYFMGKPVKYIVEDDEFKEALNDVLKDNYIDNLNFELTKEASKKGIAFELMYVDENGKLRSKKLAAEEFIPVYGVTVDEFLECGVRLWQDYDIDGQLVCDHAAVYADTDIFFFERSDVSAIYHLVDVAGTMLDDLPVILYWNNEECTGDYEDVISLIDEYDKAQSDTANDMEYFTDAYLCISGASGGLEKLDEGESDKDAEDAAARSLRQNRLLFLDEKGQAEWLVKNINDTAVENFKNRVYDNIFFLSQVPALSDSSFAGNLTGIAIKYKLIGLEQLAIMKQNRFESAQQKKISIITGFLNRKMNKQFDPQSVTRKYERNFIENVSDIIEDVTKLEGTVSKETQLNLLPNSIVDDTSAELDKIVAERQKNESLPYVTRETIEQGLAMTGGADEK